MTPEDLEAAKKNRQRQSTIYPSMTELTDESKKKLRRKRRKKVGT